MPAVKSYTKKLNGKSVHVAAHQRSAGGWPKGTSRFKIDATDRYLRLRLRDPARLRKRGFRRFRTVSGSKAKGLTVEQRELVRRTKAKVVMAFRGGLDGDGRPQSILVPRRAK